MEQPTICVIYRPGMTTKEVVGEWLAWLYTPLGMSAAFELLWEEF